MRQINAVGITKLDNDSIGLPHIEVSSHNIVDDYIYDCQICETEESHKCETEESLIFESTVFIFNTTIHVLTSPTKKIALVEHCMW